MDENYSSLENLSLIKIAAVLYKQADISDLDANKWKCELMKKAAWHPIEKSSLNKAQQLPLPSPLKRKLAGFIKPMGKELLDWLVYHRRGGLTGINLPAEFLWTPHATIDKINTAQLIIKNEALDTITRYKLACVYCFEDDIMKLWNEIPAHDRENFHVSDSDEDVKVKLIYLWTCKMKRRNNRHLLSDTVQIKNIIETCTFVGNKVAAGYFFQKLNPSEKVKCLVYLAKLAMFSNHIRMNGEVFGFLLCQLTEVDQIKVAKVDCYKILLCLTDWPVQRLFFKIVNRLWDSLSVKDYAKLLLNIASGTDYGYYYENFFREFWQGSPNALKCLNNTDYLKLLRTLLFHANQNHPYYQSEIMKIVLREANFFVRKTFIYSHDMIGSCGMYIANQDWYYLNSLFQEFFSSQDEKIKYKEEFEKYLSGLEGDHLVKDVFAKNKKMWDELFPNSNISASTNNKRSIGESEICACKRSHSITFKQTSEASCSSVNKGSKSECAEVIDSAELPVKYEKTKSKEKFSEKIKLMDVDNLAYDLEKQTSSDVKNHSNCKVHLEFSDKNPVANIDDNASDSNELPYKATIADKNEQKNVP